jgi:ATP-dependent helicase/nuclease subunit A
MTIHKSKGLEFEVVIVPDLHVPNGRSKTELLSWLERGIAEPDDSGAISEFLIAPLQYKGTDPGKSRSWVQRIRRNRETQEMRRILYVAATRAREELHLFAQATYKTSKDSSLVLVEPSKCLLATAWPAFADEIRERFEIWQQKDQAPQQSHELTLPAIAAAEQDNVIVLPRSTMVRRLPAEFESTAGIAIIRNIAESIVGLGEPFRRHEGGLQARALGNAVHKLLEEIARLRTTLEWEAARAGIESLRSRLLAQVRSTGISAAPAESIAAKAVDIAINASRDATGQWILSPHDEAISESGWAGMVNGNLRTVRVDRLFRAGCTPLQAGSDALWIIDYKTAHADFARNEVPLRDFRATFAPQLEMYGAVLRNLHGPNAQLRAGLYYPRISAFDWWEL